MRQVLLLTFYGWGVQDTEILNAAWLVNSRARFVSWGVCLPSEPILPPGYFLFQCKRDLLLQHICPWKVLEHKAGKNRNQELKTNTSQTL